jgi:hypothetical protein
MPTIIWYPILFMSWFNQFFFFFFSALPVISCVLTQDMYRDVVTFVRTCDGDTSDFPIKIGLHQGSALSPYLFALVMDEVIRDIQGGIPWCMLLVYALC